MSDIETRYLECRDFGHSWRPHTVDRTTPQRYLIRLICTRCGAVRSRLMNLQGALLRSNRYSYPPDYLQPGEGLHTQEGRAKVRAWLLADLLSADLPTTEQEQE